MPAAFPHEYRCSLKWHEDRQAKLNGTRQTEIQGGPPPQFDGRPGHWSPEELLLSSVQLCLMTTFLALLKKTDVHLHDYESETIGILDKTREGLRFTAIRVSARLDADDPDQAAELLQKAKKYCIISNALNVPVELEIRSLVS